MNEIFKSAGFNYMWERNSHWFTYRRTLFSCLFLSQSITFISFCFFESILHLPAYNRLKYLINQKEDPCHVLRNSIRILDRVWFDSQSEPQQPIMDILVIVTIMHLMNRKVAKAECCRLWWERIPRLESLDWLAARRSFLPNWISVLACDWLRAGQKPIGGSFLPLCLQHEAIKF